MGNATSLVRKKLIGLHYLCLQTFRILCHDITDNHFCLINNKFVLFLNKAALTIKDIISASK